MDFSHATLLVVILSISLTLIAAEEHSNDGRMKKAAFPAAAVSSVSGLHAGFPRPPGYFPGHSAYPYNAGLYSPHPHPHPHPHQYIPGHPLTAGYPFAAHQGYPYANPFTAGFPQAGFPHAGYHYNKFGHIASPFGYPYKPTPFDDGQYYPEKYEHPYTSYSSVF